MTKKLFVYGSLKKGGHLDYVLKKSKFIGEYTTKSKGYSMTGFWYPFVFKMEMGIFKKRKLFLEDFLHLRLGGNMESMNHKQYKPSITATIGTENMALTGGWP